MLTWGRGRRDRGEDAEVSEETGGPFSQKTAWVRRMETPLRSVPADRDGQRLGAGRRHRARPDLGEREHLVLRQVLGDPAVRDLVGSSGVSLDLREFVNSGLMALFFLVVGLEARREFDMGELRVRSRLTLPLLVGLGGMIVPIAIFLVVNAGRPAMHGWGMAMSTDTAFALGALALVGRRLPDRVRTYLLTLVLVLRARGDRYGLVYCSSGSRLVPGRGWSGPDRGRPGHRAADIRLSATRASLEQASDAFRRLRAAHRRAGAVRAQRGAHRDLAERPDHADLPPMDQLRHRVAVRAGQRGSHHERQVLARAYTAPVTLGIMIGYLVGKPVGTMGSRGWSTKLSHGRVRPWVAGARWRAPGRSPGSASPCPC